MYDPDDQPELLLPPSRRWGGRRIHAGRRPGSRPRMRHRARAVLSPHTPCHVTLRVRRGVPSLRDGRVVRAIERAFRAGCERGDFRLVEYSIQREVRNALAYVLLNFRKHEAADGGEASPRSIAPDPASSGRWFAGWTRASSTPATPTPVAPARTWLRCVGWRRHGRIDPGEIPGQRH